MSASAGALALGSSVSALAQQQGQPATTQPKTETETAKKYPHPLGSFINRPLTQISKVADTLLDDMEGRGVAYFLEQAHPQTGLVRDHAPAVGITTSRQGSIAATGFGLSALCIAANRRYLAPIVCEQRVEKTLAFLLEICPHIHGFLYHWVDIESGQRLFNSEVSSIDTSLLLCGVLHCKQYFSDNPRIVALANTFYNRIDWPWMLNGENTLSMGWTPEAGFIHYRWDTYAELLTMYLMAIGSSMHPIPAATWDAVQRPIIEYGGIEYISGIAPLFIHQYAHAWCDYRNVRDKHANYFVNSIAATRVHQLFCLTLGRNFPWINQNLWGITACNSRTGYRVWGGPPEFGDIDGTIASCAAAGSLPFLPPDCAHVLLSIRQHYGEKAWTRYGFVDAFQPKADWFAKNLLGIDLGISILMAENLRSGFVWEYFMRNPEIEQAMQQVGFHPDPDVIKVL
ncbi:MAG TPA: glucoamylase family protein [Acidobacteriaceae bacterium]|nr:glucoamylase family protein [Acidobacteriaceae bacterium]